MRKLVLLSSLCMSIIPSPAGAECDEMFVKANALFIHATVECKRDYMDTPVGYYALAMTRQCRDLGEARLMSIAKETMIQFDDIKRQKGKVAACAWTDDVEKTLRQDITR